MVKLIKGAELKTVDGEAILNITLDLNININADGSLSVGDANLKAQSVIENDQQEFEKPLPKFNNTKFKFGK